MKRSSHVRAVGISLLLASWGCLLAGPGAAPRGALPTLTTAKAIHELSVAEAQRSYPVHVRVTALVYFSALHCVFTADSTGGIYVEMKGQPVLPIREGTLLDIEGVTGMGDFAPVIKQRSVRLLGEGSLPAPRRVSLEHLSTGIEDGQFVEIEGTLRSVETGTPLLTLTVASGWSQVEVLTGDNRADVYRALIDARIRIRGPSGPVFNQRRQIMGVNMYLAGRGDIQIVEPAPADPFSLPVRPVNKLLEYTPGQGFDHRLRIRGVVTAVWPGRGLFVSDGTQGVNVLSAEETFLSPGDLVDVAGFPASGAYTPSLLHAVLRRLDRGREVSPLPISARQALSGDYDADLVRIDGRLLHLGRTGNEYSFLTESGGLVFSATLPLSQANEGLDSLRDGSTLELTGICLAEDTRASVHFRVPTTFQLLLRSPADIRVLHRPSWWTPGHALYVLALTGLIALTALSWIAALRNRVKEQTRIIQEQLEEAAVLKETAIAASRAKSDFLANMSHEIRTPINGIMGMTELVLDSELTTDQRECLEMASAASDSLLTIINDVLDFSKIEAGRLDLEPIEFDLRDALEETIRALAARAHLKNLELTCEVASCVPPRVIGDPTRLRQVVTNLVGNAIKFTDSGEVGLEVAEDADGVDVRALRFTVRDTGAGIALEKQALIFEAFSQAEASTTRNFGGTGLGLSISKRLVEMMGGRIWVESVPGHGSQFHFTARFGLADSTAQVPFSTPELLRDVRVLIADDNAASRRILAGLVSEWGMLPALASDGEEALDALIRAARSDSPFRLVLADAVMPGLSGYALAAKMRLNPDLAAASTVVLTAGRSAKGAQDGGPGVARTLAKPVRRDDLLQVIAATLAAAALVDSVPE